MPCFFSSPSFLCFCVLVLGFLSLAIYLAIFPSKMFWEFKWRRWWFLVSVWLFLSNAAKENLVKWGSFFTLSWSQWRGVLPTFRAGPCAPIEKEKLQGYGSLVYGTSCGWDASHRLWCWEPRDEFVVESTDVFTDKDKVAVHLKGGAKEPPKRLLMAP